LKYEEIRKYIPEFLNSNGKVVLYRTEAITKQEIGDEFQFVNETAIALPHGYGKRIVSVIERKNL